MLHVFVASKNQAVDLVKKHNATHWISILDLGDRQFIPPIKHHCNILHLNFEDALVETQHGAPTIDHVKIILDFTKDLHDGTIVVNCFAGVSRSAAAALAILVQYHKNIEKSVNLLLDVRPHAIPNPVISQYADQLLGYNGKLLEASEKIATARLFKFYGKKSI